MVNIPHLLFTLSILTFTNGLPFELNQKPRVGPRAKTYSVVNVDGGSTVPPSATTIVEEKTTTRTETFKVTDAAPIPTDTATAVIVNPTPAPAPTTSTSSSSSLSTTASTPGTTSPASSETPTQTPLKSIVTVVVTETAAPTEYYDDGMWHTRYPVKTFQAVTVINVESSMSTLVPYATSFIPQPTITISSVRSYNQTQVSRRQ